MATEGLKIKSKRFVEPPDGGSNQHYIVTRRPKGLPKLERGSCQGGGGSLTMVFSSGNTWSAQFVEAKGHTVTWYVGGVDKDREGLQVGDYITSIRGNGQTIYNASTEAPPSKSNPLKLLLLMQLLKGS